VLEPPEDAVRAEGVRAWEGEERFGAAVGAGVVEA
jgi:hypothetical protein